MKRLNLLFYQIAFLLATAPILASENVDLDTRTVTTDRTMFVSTINDDMDLARDTALSDAVNNDNGLTHFFGKYVPNNTSFLLLLSEEILLFIASCLEDRCEADMKYGMSIVNFSNTNRLLRRIAKDIKLLHLYPTPYLKRLLVARFVGLSPEVTGHIGAIFAMANAPLLSDRLMEFANELQYNRCDEEDPEAIVESWQAISGALRVAEQLGQKKARTTLMRENSTLSSRLDDIKSRSYTTPHCKLLAVSTLYRQCRYINYLELGQVFTINVVGEDVESYSNQQDGKLRKDAASFADSFLATR